MFAKKAQQDIPKNKQNKCSSPSRQNTCQEMSKSTHVCQIKLGGHPIYTCVSFGIDLDLEFLSFAHDALPPTGKHIYHVTSNFKSHFRVIDRTQHNGRVLGSSPTLCRLVVSLKNEL